MTSKETFGSGMKTARGWIIALAFALLIPIAAAAQQLINVDMNAGEAYVITGVQSGTSPEVKFDNPDAFSVQTRSATELLVLAVQAGKGTIKVQTDHGEITYSVRVTAIADAHDRLKPGVAPPAIGESKPSASKLDAGAGPSGAKPAVSSSSPSAPAAPSKPAVIPVSYTPSSPAAWSAPAVTAPTSGSSLAPARPSQTANSQEAVSTPAPIVEKYKANPPAAFAKDSFEREPGIGGRHYLPNDAIAMMTGTSRVYDFHNPMKRVSVADTKIADIQVVNPNQLMLIGHTPGFTTLVVWDGAGNYEERQVRIEKEGHQQVLLDVVVAEVNRTKLESEGIDFSAALTKYGLSLAGLPGSVATPYTPNSNLDINGPHGTTHNIPPFGGNYFPLLFGSNATFLLSGSNQDVNANAFFEFVESHQLGRILARPHILANSGEEAKFLSGGEIPIVIAQALNTSIVFKPFGTSVVFLPTVVGKDEVELIVKPEVSKPDFASGVQLQGFNVPAFVTRRAETQVRMKQNQTLIIAGLILDDNTSTIRKVPYLGDIPWAGALFRSTSWNHTKTELVMTVRPTIVQPIPGGSEFEMPTERGPMTFQETKTTPLTTPDVTRPRLY